MGCRGPLNHTKSGTVVFTKCIFEKLKQGKEHESAKTKVWETLDYGNTSTSTKFELSLINVLLTPEVLGTVFSKWQTTTVWLP